LARDGNFGIPYPCVFGHEGAGIVVSAGSAVQHVNAGDRVLMSGSHCGDCAECQTGHAVYCARAAEFGMVGRRPDGSTTLTAADGQDVAGCFIGQSSFATHVIARAANVVKVPDDLPLHVLAPLACGVCTGAGTVLDVLSPNAGSTIAIYGVGSVGLSAVMAAKVAACSRVIAVDVHDDRLELAASLGATDVINARDVDPVEEIRRITGVGTDFAVEATGVEAVGPQAVGSTTPTGTTALVGVPSGAAIFTIPWFSLITGRTVRGVVLGGTSPSAFIPRAIDLYRRGIFPIDRLVTEYEFGDIGSAVTDMESGRAVKPVLIMPGHPER
jgi:aryl-alcohol dehydrogenase